MKISFSTLGCPRWSWREILATACDLGYGGVEVRGVGNDISVPSIPAFSDENLDKTKAELARLNLAIPCLDSDCCIHLRETEQTTNEEIRAYIHLAQKLGVWPGSVTPFAALNEDTHTVRVAMDADFAAMGWIGCHPCDNTASVHLRTSDLLALLADAGVDVELLEV